MADPRWKDALLELAKLISVFDESGSPDFGWFGDPIGKGTANLPARRDHFGKLIQALAGRGPMDSPEYDATHVWETLLDSPVELGFAWTKPEHDLRLGIGSKASFTVGQQKLALGALVGLVKVAGDQLDHDFGRVVFTGQLPVPPFLKSAQIAGTIAPDTQQLQLAIGDASQTCSISPFSNANVHWDFARQAVFALCCWLRWEAAKPNASEVFKRIANHLLPLFGTDGKGIAPFPLFDGHVPAKMGTVPDFGPWADSMVADGGKGAMTGLWHLRALVTGNESKDMFGGSAYVPLHSLGGLPGTIDQQGWLAGLGSLVLQNVPAGAAGHGVYLGVIWDAAKLDSFKLVLRVIGTGGDATVDIVALTKAANGKWSVGGTPPTFATFSSVLAAGMPASANPYIEVVSATATQIVLKLGKGLLDFTGPFGGTWALALTVTITAGPPARVVFGIGIGPKGAPLVELKLGGAQPVDLSHPKPSAVLALLGQGQHAAVLASIGTLLDEVVGPPPKAPTAATALAMLHAAAATNELEFEAGPLTIGLKSEASQKLVLEVELEIKGLDPDDELPIHIGGVTAKFGLQVAPTVDIRSLSFGLLDMRLGQLGLGGTIGEMLPDLREAQGLDLRLGYGAGGIELAGEGAIPIQQAIGPFQLSTLRFEFDKDSLDVGVDGQFSMGGVVIAPYGLGVSIPFDGGVPDLRLDGLGLSFDASGLTMTGMFARVQGPNGDDYLGAAVLGVFDLFELAAIGGYTDIPDGKGGSEPSLFIFASLEAPLGGPPYCFITGLAGGFGFNRKLAKVERVSDHPLLKVMKGEAIDTNDMIGSLTKLGQQFLPEKGEWWIAAGVQFTSFAFIAGKLLAVLSVGKSFRIELIGSAAFGLDPVAYFELDFGVFVDAESFLLRADLSPNSYIIHPDIFSLHGSFGLGVWYGGEHAGDFVLSIGGYHPYWLVPAHYPQLDRVGVKAVVYDFVHFEVSAYFALTPRAIMTGAAISLWAEFAGISAGLDVYVDVLIQWDPFYLSGRMGVALWFVFMGRHEISVDLQIWTPELGGIATVDLALISFDVAFGADPNQDPPLEFWQFVDSQLKVPATPTSSGMAALSAFDDGQDAGLLKLDVVWGRAVEKSESEGTGQEGLQASKPILVGPEFGLRLRSRMPAGPASGTVVKSGTQVAIEGEIDLPLCGIDDLDSKLWLKAPGVQQPQVGTDSLISMFPAAQFGTDFESSNANNSRQLAAEEAGAEVKVPAIEGLALHFHPDFQPSAAANWIIRSSEEPSVGTERYPLPLDVPGKAGIGRQVGKVGKAGLSRLASLRTTSALLSAKPAAAVAPATLAIADVPRTIRRAKPVGVLAAAAGIQRVAVPLSPARRSELAAIELELIQPEVRIGRQVRGTQRIAKMVQRGPALLGAAQMGMVSKLGADPRKPSMSVAAGKAAMLRLGDLRVRGQAVVTGNQTLRLVFVSRFGRPVGDAFVHGSGSLMLPRGTRSVIAFGEGNDAPVLGHAPPLAREVVGVDQDSLLIAIGHNDFVARGCSIESNARLPDRADPLDVVMGAELLRRSTLVELGFPALPAEASVIVVLRAKTRTPGPVLDRLAWSSLDADLGTPQVLAQPGRVALVFPARATQPWTLRAELLRDFEFHGLAACPRSVEASLAALRADPSWDLVDDRWTPAADSTSTVRLELVR
jgi:hypothetical protein